MRKILLFTLFVLVGNLLNAQSGLIQGSVIDFLDRSGLPYANISIDNEAQVFTTDSLGDFSIELKPGYHNVTVSYLSYESKKYHQVKVDPIKPNNLVVTLKQSNVNLDEIVVKGKSQSKTSETPLSIKSIGINEITRLPGTTIDVSKVIKNLPGVLPKVSFGYNIIVRGGASHENKFYIEGIEIPSINHFSVQGVSGGPNGMINVDLLKGANLITGAFPANRYNALSSVLNLNTRSGRTDRLGGKFTLGATDVGLSLEGPLSKNSNFIISGRKSFSEYYLKAFKLPVLPAYSDYNFKFESRWKRNELKIIGIGAVDQSRLNLDDANKPDASVGLLYNTGYIPEGDQNVHTLGLNYKKFSDYGYSTIILSTSYFRNKAIKYFDNSFEQEDLWFDYDATEMKTQARFEQNIYVGDNELRFGVSLENSVFSLDNYAIEIGQENLPFIVDFDSKLSTLAYGAFVSYSRKFLNDKLNIFGGLRMDANSYGDLTQNPLDQVSPRISASYKVTNKSTISTNIGSYYQLPPSTILAYSEDGALVNQNRIGYINSNQLALGYSYQISEDKIVSIETFYKQYDKYPFLLRDSISFANANADYVAVGNQPASSTTKGRAYGVELFIQKKFRKNSLWSASYNYSVSEFEDKNGDFVSSSWDTRHFLNLVYAKTFGKNWQIGGKFTFASASPYTPFDQSASSQKAFWDLNRRGIFDYDQLNTAFLKPFRTLDFRIDKNVYYKKFTANFYLDIQNISSSAIEYIPYLVPVRNEDGSFKLDPENPNQYQTELITSDSGRVLPTIGIIIEI
ncbi:TonB-dependent receptor [Portibacter lacus]|uniref:Collagen-binding protein n=1 Tax=Portibacter lacus TaxID=1099794 RepID=A0AA37WE42_9BACT|nr:carboxypeptidase-like regulatory domain-containing protein [Portibacter lacus]GLR16259.1 collagen-binding protein [Portibacter lacus]